MLETEHNKTERKRSKWTHLPGRAIQRSLPMSEKRQFFGIWDGPDIICKFHAMGLKGHNTAP